MKITNISRSVAFVPMILSGVLVLNSFTSTTRKAPNDAGSPAVSNIIFRSADGGQTWQDISNGLPEKLKKEGVWKDGFIANNRGLFLRAGDGLYHTETSAPTPFWEKERFPGTQRNIAAANNGLLAYNFRGQFLKQLNGRDEWSPVYTNFQAQAVRLDKTTDWMYKNYKEREVRSVFESAAGTVFVASGNGLFRSADDGKTWKHVHTGDGSMKLAELNGVLLSTGRNGILRSADDGKTWTEALTEGGAGIAVEPVSWGFAAIVYNADTRTNNLHISHDNGKTWTPAAQALKPSWSNLILNKIGLVKFSNILSVKQMGRYLLCSRADGLFRSPDMGKTWEELPVPAVENYGFSLSVSGNMMYLIPGKGC